MKLTETEMHETEKKCCLQRLQTASYLKHNFRRSYANPLACHAVHQPHGHQENSDPKNHIKHEALNIRLGYKDHSRLSLRMFYKTSTACILQIF